jgi:hypothetical protein
LHKATHYITKDRANEPTSPDYEEFGHYVSLQPWSNAAEVYTSLVKIAPLSRGSV